MPANKTALLAARISLILLLCFASAPSNFAEAQPVPPYNPSACRPTFTQNAYQPASAVEAYPQPTEPIEIFFGSNTYASIIQGLVVPDSDVVIVVRIQGGSDAWTLQTRSDSSGYYRIPANGKTCSTGSSTWLYNQDLVIVTVGQESYVTVARHFEAVANPVTDTVSGPLGSGFIEEVKVEEPLSNTACGNSGRRILTTTVTTQVGDWFVAAFDDFGARALATLRIRDQQGVSYFQNEAQRVTLDRDTGRFYGYIETSGTVPVTYTLTRADQVIETVDELTKDYIGHVFTEPLQPGDVIRASTAGQVLYNTVVFPFTASLDVEMDRITGLAGPGVPVQITLTQYYRGAMYHAHCWDFEFPSLCALPGSDGVYDVQSPLDIRPGDSAEVVMYDEYGNIQRRSLDSGSFIYYDQNNREVESYFQDTNGNSLTLKVLDAQETLLWQQSVVPGAYQYYDWYLPYDLVIPPSSRIEVSSGSDVKSMTVPDLAVDPLHGQIQVSGSAPDGIVIVEHYDEDLDRQSYTCAEGVSEGGHFSVSTGSEPITGVDEFWFTHYNNQGGYFSTARTSRFLIIGKDTPGAAVQGSLEQPGKNITLTHSRGGSVVGSAQMLTSGMGSFIGTISSESVFRQGDRVAVALDGSETFEMEVPELEASIDHAAGQIVGRAPGSRSVFAYLYRKGGSGATSNSGYVQVYPDESGNIRADLPELPDRDSCGTFPLDACLQISLISLTPEGNLVGWTGPAPIGVTADAFEPDDTREAARELASQPQHRTILAANEEDWARVEVSPRDVGKAHTITVSDLGLEMSLSYEFFHADGVTNRVTGTFSQSGISQFSVLPVLPGTYYLKLKAPPATFQYGACDSVYMLALERETSSAIYLPSIYSLH